MDDGRRSAAGDAAQRPLLPRAALLAAARELNSGRYFEAHEALEDALDDTADELWSLALGLIQVAVGYHKLSQGLLPGAARMLELGVAKLSGYTGGAGGIEVDAFRARAARDLEDLRAKRHGAAVLRADPPRLRLSRPR